MFGIGGFELFIILIFGFLIFGPDKLPEIAKTVGKGIVRFREAQQEVNDAIGDEKIIDLGNPDQPFKDPIEALDRIAKRQEEKKAGTSSKASSGTSAKASSSAKAGEASSSGDDEPKQESFTERKARYERERAARKAAEAQAAKANAEASPENPVSATPAPASGESAAPAIPTEGATPSVILSEATEGSEVEGSRALPDQPAEAPAEGGDA